MAEILEKMEKVAKEVGVIEEKVEAKRKGLGVAEGQPVMTIEEATTKSEAELKREQLAVLVDYWTAHNQWVMKKELLEALKTEVKQTATRGQMGGGVKGVGRGGNWAKMLDFKVVAHMKDAKFGGKDGDVGWANFFEDLMVAIGSVDKELEAAVKAATDMKNKELDKSGAIRMSMDEDVWEKYSGELFARLMEITKDEAQKLVRNEGTKSGRCGFWTLRKMMERFNPRSYMRLLRLLLSVIKPTEA